MNMHRRSFLTKLLLSVTGIVGSGTGLLANWASEDYKSSTFESLFSDMPSAQRIGKRYLASYEDQDSVDAILERKLMSLQMRHSASPNQQIRAQEIRLLIREDYNNNCVVSIDGWILSITEAQLCATVALS